MRRDAEILAHWDGRSLKAAGWADRDAIAAFPAGTTFALKVWEPATRAARAFISKFIEVCAENCPEAPGRERITADLLKGAIKAEFGWFLGEIEEADGSKVRTYKSIGKMTREELVTFTDQAKQFVEIEMGLDAEAMAKEAMDRIRPRRAQS